MSLSRSPRPGHPPCDTSLLALAHRPLFCSVKFWWKSTSRLIGPSPSLARKVFFAFQMPQTPQPSSRQRQRVRRKVAMSSAFEKLQNIIRAHRKENKRNGKIIADLHAHVALLKATASSPLQRLTEGTRKIAEQAALIGRCAASIKKWESETDRLRKDRDKWFARYQQTLPVYAPIASTDPLVSRGGSPDLQFSPCTPPTPGRQSSQEAT